MINSNYYDVKNWERYGFGSKEDTLIIAIIIIVSLAGLIVSIYAMSETTKWETYINKAGQSATRMTANFSGLIVGVVCSSMTLLFSIIGSSVHYASKNMDTIEIKRRPKHLSDKEIEELNSKHLTLDRAREILFYYNHTWHEERVANLGPSIRAPAPILSPEDSSWIDIVNQYNKNLLIIDCINSSASQKLKSANRLQVLKTQWEQLHCSNS